MNTPEAETVSEADEIIGALSSDADTREVYSGEADYLLVEDIATRIDRAAVSSGNEFYTTDMTPFEDFDGDPETLATVFYNVEAGTDLSEISEEADISKAYASTILSDFEDEGLVEKRGTTAGKDFFYGEEAFPYLMVFEDAREIVENYGDRSEAHEESFEQESTGEEIEPETEGTEAEDEEEKDYHDILMDVADSEDDLVEVEKQKEDGGIETRDHVDSEGQEVSNPGEDEYYEGW